MKIDDETFSRFVGNALSHERMIEVEHNLIEEDEAYAAILASIADYSIQSDLADFLVGVDETKKRQRQKDRKTNLQDSIRVNTQTNTHKTMKDNKITKDEILKVQELVSAYGNQYNENVTLDENLENFYLAQRPGALPEDARRIIEGLHLGINTFNANLQQALSEQGFDYAAELHKLSTEMTLEQKYELYINFLAAVTTLNMENMTEEQMSEIDSYLIIKDQLQPIGEVTEEMLAEVEHQIGEVLNNNTLCLGTLESMGQLMASLPEGEAAVMQAIAGSEDDVKQKLVLSMATYILYENGEIEAKEQMTPESIAVATAMGVEQAKVIDDVQAGRKSVDVAIRILKIIGGVALFSLLALTVLHLIPIATAVGISASLIMSIFAGSTVIGGILSLVFGASISIWLVISAIEISTKIFKFSSRTFDVIVKVWRETVWPKVKQVSISVWNWIKDLIVSGKAKTRNDAAAMQTAMA